MGEFEEQYEDVLQNIEFALVQVYRADEEMTDFDALQAINALIRTYQAEERRRQPSALRLLPAQEAALESVQGMCELRLGRAQLRKKMEETEETAELPPMIAPITLAEIIACLKRVRKSIELWRKEGGRRGYYDFVSPFLP
jgi:hypothetical protein